METMTLRRTELHNAHLAAGAKMVPFAGFEMPVQYSGLKVEHEAVRTASGMFDVSHMGEFMVEGPDALAPHSVDQLQRRVQTCGRQGSVCLHAQRLRWDCRRHARVSFQREQALPW